MSETGTGSIEVAREGGRVSFRKLASTYPLKLLSPRIPSDWLAVVYILSYGGGLVGGDHLEVRVEVGSMATLLVLSQGSTKVFKQKVQDPHSKDINITTQHLHCQVHPDASLLLLPDPVTCFQAASYEQIQTFHLSSTSSLVLLDWITSGRKARGENWLFERYYSRNEIWIDGVRIGKDALLLAQNDNTTSLRSLAERLAPFTCYAMLFLVGPLVEPIVSHLTREYAKISINNQTSLPQSTLWSLSIIPHSAGNLVLVRIAGRDTEMVREWLDFLLREIEYFNSWGGFHPGLTAFSGLIRAYLSPYATPLGDVNLQSNQVAIGPW